MATNLHHVFGFHRCDVTSTSANQERAVGSRDLGWVTCGENQRGVFISGEWLLYPCCDLKTFELWTSFLQLLHNVYLLPCDTTAQLSNKRLRTVFWLSCSPLNLVCKNMASSSFQPRSAAVMLSSNVELSISCNNLKDCDVFSKSDPMCVIYLAGFGNSQYMEFGRTECIMNNLNPEFTKKFIVPFVFEENQKMKFELYDIDSNSTNLADHDFLGCMFCTLAEIVGSGSFSKSLILHGTAYGTITVRAEELAVCKEKATMQFIGTNLDKKSHFLFWGSSSPFLTLSRANEDSTFTVVHRTEPVRSDINPTWKPFTVSGNALCNSDCDRLIKIQCHDWQLNGSHKFIGECFTTFAQLKEFGSGHDIAYELINPKKQTKRPGYVNSGSIRLINCQVQETFTFIDYISAGTELMCTVAIDFTASNGDPRNSSSLHYISNAPNQYEQALRAVGEIIQDYDSDKLFPVLGFGARLPPNGSVSHEFFVNFDQYNPHCAGIDGIVAAYHNCLEQVQLYGPTNFASVIRHVARFAQATRDGSKYHILLIITDGIITDMPQTKAAIVEASSLPMSIIIVGVGRADFTAMEILDGDEVRLSSGGRQAVRDIVQFVPFHNFQTGLHGTATHAMTQALLAREVLAEIPDQFLSFMEMNRIKPGNLKTAKSNNS